MKLNYLKISKTLYKFFYEGKGYGEFYIDIKPDKENAITGTADLMRKDPDYAVALLEALSEELDPKCPHENIIDAGDNEHSVSACTDCGKLL